VWPDRVGDWVALAADATAVVVGLTVLALWLGGRNPVVAHALRASRARTVGRVLRERGWSRRATARACRQVVRGTLEGTAFPGVEGELEWLDQVALAAGRPAAVTVHGLGGPPHEDLRRLADGYRALSRRLRSRGLLGGGTAPLLADVSDVAERTAALLSTHAAFARPGRTPGPDDAGLELRAAAGRTRVELHNLRTSAGPGSGIDGLAVSHVHERVVVAGSLMQELCAEDGVRAVVLPLTAEEAAISDERLSGKFFDGALPSLRGAHRQRDPSSGWTRLHLVLAEAAYSAVVATHYTGTRGVGRTAAELRGEAALLTLSCLPVTVDDRVLMVRRSANVMTDRGRWAPAVNGNLEMRPRFGIAVDRDENGIPEPLRAIAREAKEELGITVPARDLEVLGTALFDSDQEIGTGVLLTTVPLGLTAQDVVARSRFADATEGRWENQGEVLAVPVPRDVAARDALLAWTLTTADHQPHLTACLVALSYPHLMEGAGGDPDAVHHHLGLLAERDNAGIPAGTVLLDRDVVA